MPGHNKHHSHFGFVVSLCEESKGGREVREIGAGLKPLQVHSGLITNALSVKVSLFHSQVFSQKAGKGVVDQHMPTGTPGLHIMWSGKGSSHCLPSWGRCFGDRVPPGCPTATHVGGSISVSWWNRLTGPPAPFPNREG